MHFYTRSDGTKINVEDMHLAHLRSSIDKMVRNDPHNEELGPMRESYDRRKAIWDQEQVEKQAAEQRR